MSMTESEKYIEIIKSLDCENITSIVCEYDKTGCSDCSFMIAKNKAIQALKEIQQYRAIGTVSEFRELKEKAKPKQTIEKQKTYSEEVGFNSDMICPNCGAYVGYWMEGMGTEADQMEYCCDCGQHLANDLEDKEVR